MSKVRNDRKMIFQFLILSFSWENGERRGSVILMKEAKKKKKRFAWFTKTYTIHSFIAWRKEFRKENELKEDAIFGRKEKDRQELLHEYLPSFPFSSCSWKWVNDSPGLFSLLLLTRCAWIKMRKKVERNKRRRDGDISRRFFLLPSAWYISGVSVLKTQVWEKKEEEGNT